MKLVYENINEVLDFEREKRLKIQYVGKYLKKEHTPDFVCCGKIVLELKAARELTEIHQAQLFNYLKASKFRMVSFSISVKPHYNSNDSFSDTK